MNKANVDLCRFVHMNQRISCAVDKDVHSEAVRLSTLPPKQTISDYITEALKEKNEREAKKRQSKNKIPLIHTFTSK